MAVHYLRYTFLHKVDVYELDEEYQKNYVKNQLNKVLGYQNIFEYDQTEVLHDDYQPVEGS